MKKGKISITKRSFICSVVFLFLFGSHLSFASLALQEVDQQDQSYTEYKGEVLDSKSSEPLVFADLNVSDTNISTITNTEGEFLLKVPNDLLDKSVTISFLGYNKYVLPLSEFNKGRTKIKLDVFVTQLTQVSLKVPKDAISLVRATLKRKGGNYYNNQAIMTAFYRETIKKRRKNASLSEAVLEIYKQPYASKKRDHITLVKARKSTDYTKLDTLALKLQGGPFSALYADIVKYPEFIFTENNLSEYMFSFDNFTQIDDRKVYVVNFKPQPDIDYPLYSGKLYIDADTFSLTSAIYNLNVENKELASKMFVRKKPRNAKVYPTKAAYRVDYRTKEGKWYYGYSNIQLTFKVNWEGKLFNSMYSLTSEMAITDWAKNTTGITKPKSGLKSTVILSDEASGFSDPKFWGEYNIIEPEKSIESAIKKINKQLKRSES